MKEEGGGGKAKFAGPVLSGAAGGLDIGAILGQAAGGGVAGAVVTAIVGLIKNRVAA